MSLYQDLLNGYSNDSDYGLWPPGAAMQQQQNSFLTGSGIAGLQGLSQQQAQLQQQSQDYFQERERIRKDQEEIRKIRDEVSKYKAQKALEEKKRVNSVKCYIEKHRDVLYTICLALIVDHFVLNGAIRHRIQRLIEAMLSKVEGMLGVKDEKDAIEVTPA